MAKQIEGVADTESINIWMKANGITLSEDALHKLQEHGFLTMEDLRYCSVQEMDNDAKEEMSIKLADRKKLIRAMQILTEDPTEKTQKVAQPAQVITLMGDNESTYTENTGMETKTNAYDEEDLFIGNLHKLMKTHQYSSGKPRHSHEWTLFITTSKHKLSEPQSIKQVTYYLHSTFTPSIITVQQTPFILKRTGWGPFGVKAKIQFHDKYKRKDVFCAHILNFKHNVTVTHVSQHNSMVVDAVLSDAVSTVMSSNVLAYADVDVLRGKDPDVHHFKNYDHYVDTAPIHFRSELLKETTHI
eukprot:249068_1